MNVSEKPIDFDSYWQSVDDELDGYSARPLLEEMPRHSTEFFTVYWVKLTSSGPYRIGGYLSIPTGSGRFPAIMNTPGYGSVNHVPHYNDRLRYVVLTLMHRGQRLVDQPFAAAYPGLLTYGIGNSATYIYRGVVADCLRGAEFLLEHEKVDPQKVSIVGGDLALITAARRARISFAQSSGLIFYRLAESYPHVSAYPVEEINDYLRANPDKKAQVRQTLSYCDPIHHAPSVAATTLLSIDDPGTRGGPEWMQPLIEALGGSVEQYQITHEGGTDNGYRDARLAARTGVQPMSQFERTYRS